MASSEVQQSDALNVVSQHLPKVSWGKGSYVCDVDGKQYIDGSGGPAVYCIGHGNIEVNAAIQAQLAAIAHGYRYNFTSDALEELTEIVARNSGGDLQKMVFVTGGSEAIESSLKIALQYHSARGDMGRRRFISRQRSWHGNTLGALSVSGFRERRLPYEGALAPASFLRAANMYRLPPGVDGATAGIVLAQELEEEILRLGPDKVAAVIFEPVVGAAGACVPAPDGYAKRIREICDRHGVLMIADEVMCGAGRCGTWRALEPDGVWPDIMSIAKGLAGGYLPLGAAVYSKKIAEVLDREHGGPLTGHTFTGHTACCAAGVAVQKIVMREQLVERVQRNEFGLRQRLRDATEGVVQIGDIRGRGHFLALEIVKDPETKEPYPSEFKVYQRIRERTLNNGLICYPVGGIVDGVVGDGVIIAPPYNATAAELDEIADKLGRSIREVLSVLPDV